MRSWTGTCHCGAVEFEFDAEEITRGLRCNCSMCKRLGVVMSMKINPEDFRVIKGREALRIYLWNDRVVPHSYCSNCGIYVFYDGDIQCRVNLGCVDAVDTFALEIVAYDGKHLL